MAKRLHGSVVALEKLSTTEVAALYQLFSDHYLQVDGVTFDRDLQEKDAVLSLYDEYGVVRGFTTLMTYELQLAGQRIRIAFSGNTIIDPEYWGGQELVRTWTQFMAEEKAKYPNVPLYWYLICSGYRTYMFLPLFYHEFYPRYDRPTPEFEQSLIDTLGRRKYPEEYDDGIIRVAHPRECLRSDLAHPSAHKLRKPHIRFFFERNPGYHRGDELACLAEFRLSNIRGFPKKIARKVLDGASRLGADAALSEPSAPVLWSPSAAIPPAEIRS